MHLFFLLIMNQYGTKRLFLLLIMDLMNLWAVPLFLAIVSCFIEYLVYSIQRERGGGGGGWGGGEGGEGERGGGKRERGSE